MVDVRLVVAMEASCRADLKSSPGAAVAPARNAFECVSLGFQSDRREGAILQVTAWRAGGGGDAAEDAMSDLDDRPGLRSVAGDGFLWERRIIVGVPLPWLYSLALARLGLVSTLAMRLRALARSGGPICLSKALMSSADRTRPGSATSRRSAVQPLASRWPGPDQSAHVTLASLLLVPRNRWFLRCSLVVLVNDLGVHDVNRAARIMRAGPRRLVAWRVDLPTPHAGLGQGRRGGLHGLMSSP